jgi:hypothetical protein
MAGAGDGAVAAMADVRRIERAAEQALDRPVAPGSPPD